MSNFQAAHAQGKDWREVARALVSQLGDTSGATLGFLYLTESLAADAASILMLLRAATGIDRWTGTSAIGICAPGVEIFGHPAASVMTVALDPDAFCLFPAMAEDEVRGLKGEFGPWLRAHMPMLGIVHADPKGGGIQDIVADLAELSGAFLVGGVASGELMTAQISDAVTDGGVSGVLFASSAPIITGLTQGCVPIGPAHIVSRCAENVIARLDDRPAFTVFEEAMQELGVEGAREERAGDSPSSLHVGLAVSSEASSDYLVRNLMGVDPDNGLIAVGDQVYEGQHLLFVRRSHHTAMADLRRMLADLKARIGSGVPKGGVYVSCLARGPSTFGPDSGELQTIREFMGDMPLAGFFANGEICDNRIYGYTGVLTVFL